MKLGSLFDGSGGFPLAAQLCGIEPVWASEVEPFPIAVTRKRFPQMKHLGDVSAINGAEIEPVDIITFGSPCQDLSVAGKRAGLDGERSGLFMEAIRIIKEMREATDGRYPNYAIWENVPGAFSSAKGEDFRAVLQAFVGIADETAYVPRPPQGKWNNSGEIVGDGWSAVWRVLDAQGWGVPQRRRRIFLVADYHSERAGEILFKRDGLSRDFAEIKQSWQNPAAAVETGVGDLREPLMQVYDTRGNGNGAIVPTITGDHENRVTDYTAVCIGIDPYNASETGDKAATLGVNCGLPDGRNGVITLDRAAFNQGANAQYDPGIDDSGKHYSVVAKGPGAVCYGVRCLNPEDPQSARIYSADGVYPALNANSGGGQSREAVSAIQGSMLGRKDENGPQGDGINEDVSFTLNTIDRHGVCYAVNEQTGETVTFKLVLRRLMPVECARLQGFPDWWTDDLENENPTEEEMAFWRDVFETHRRVITGASKPKTDKQIMKWLKSPKTDAAEYKMWGNGVALPCVLYVMEGIAREKEEI